MPHMLRTPDQAIDHYNREHNNYEQNTYNDILNRRSDAADICVAGIGR
ncbi:MAG: hypothetical protein U9Q68_05540 [Euryarchaeota archaeon]|nr:hypothetical protein [Euryarchaeota archaeon]